MASNLLRLEQREHDLNTELRALAETIDREGRALSAEERSRRDEIMAELPDLRADIAFAKEQREALRNAPGAVEVRDTQSTTPFRSLGEQLLAVRQAAIEPHRPDPRPVSYTHLTLPTNREV